MSKIEANLKISMKNSEFEFKIKEHKNIHTHK